MIRPTPSMVHSTSVRESFRPGHPGFWTHPDWEVRFPWLIQGTTGGAPELGHEAADFALFPAPACGGGLDSWSALGSRLGFRAISHSHQVHAKTVLVHRPVSGVREGLIVGPDADGHVTSSEGLLLGVTGADCVPVFLVDPSHHGIGLLHAGWRGTVAGILEEGLTVMSSEFGSSPRDLFVHLGPSICGRCYEVGQEVHTALGLRDPGGATPVNLRGHLAGRAAALGIPKNQLTHSEWCTLCGGSGFFSHRGGDAGRQVGFLGIRTVPGGPTHGGGVGP